LAWALWRHAPHGVEDAVRGVDAVQVLGDFGAQKSLGHRMGGVALNARSPAVFYGDQYSAGVGTIVRAGGMDDLLHDLDIIEGFTARGRKERALKQMAVSKEQLAQLKPAFSASRGAGFSQANCYLLVANCCKIPVDNF
jgi:hypothetical protein